ncbi:hypothetical protein M413DRAFT_440002 [Hebeloma cylindrosporum]|uniref:Uncharacterized protein n=1 Tax=Hebeloma cylindrosporum TaxID=76867 RepID=A0A0C2Z504_HEBCY|nr:hypothetical protein M413DRAFT_440002 [Hebeloma cylindrosporum h7]
MPLRALRLLRLPTHPEDKSLSFSATLQLAASRAWTRHADACSPARREPSSSNCENPRPTLDRAGKNYHTRPPKKTTLPNQLPTLRRKSKSRSANIVDFDPFQNAYEPTGADDPQRDLHARDFLSEIPAKTLPQILNFVSPAPLRPGEPPLLPTPKSRTSLYRNLLYLRNMHTPTRLPALIDYHSLYPQWQSTPSYNLLIELAIRHRAYETVRRIVIAQDANNIPKNLESHKLEVRWFVYQGLWDDAWRYVQRLKDNGTFSTKGDANDIPLPIWLEFFSAPKKRRAFHYVPTDRGHELHHYSGKTQERYEDLLVRQRILNDNRPQNMPPLAQTSPFAIYCIVNLLVRSSNRDRALALTKAFFESIPRYMDARKVRRCLSIIHVHLVYCPATNGLPRFYESRRTLISLLKLHPSLRPNSRTLFLLLAPLQRAKRCGTIASKTLKSFKSQWGPQVEDRRVQRRVTQLALKEGRMDIVENITRQERSERRYRRRRLLEEHVAGGITRVASRWHIRFPLRKVFPRNGRETRLWVRLKSRTRLKTRANQGIQPR